MDIVKLTDVPTFYKDLPHQQHAVKWLGGNLLTADIAKEKLNLETEFDWLRRSPSQIEWLQKQISIPTLQTFTKKWRHQDGIKFIDSDDDPEDIKVYKKLPYFTQLDNPIKPHSTCFSSSTWMAKESIFYTGKDDANYVKQVMGGKFGRKGYSNPSIYWDVHVKGLAFYGIKAQINWSNSWDEAINQFEETGFLTPINLLHRRHISNPGGGHIVCLGALERDANGNKTGRIEVRDPYGELNLINGTSDLKASGIYYATLKNLRRRWQGLSIKYLGKL